MSTAIKDWGYCPECGSTKSRSDKSISPTHLQCEACLQEYFSDVDYTETVGKNLNRLTKALWTTREVMDIDKRLLQRVIDEKEWAISSTQLEIGRRTLAESKVEHLKGLLKKISGHVVRTGMTMFDLDEVERVLK